MPVIHLTCWLESEKPLLNDATKLQDLYQCNYMYKRKNFLLENYFLFS
jgi:hypothetical protein